jgi:Fic family protein
MDPRQVDARYQPFPPFEEWANAVVDALRWETFTAEVDRRREVATPEVLKRAQEIVERAAAIDTGAIEGLYEVDRGFTFSVAKQAAAWEAMIDEKGAGVRALFESQLAGYDFVMDLATRSTPVTEAWIRQLHAEMCRSQDTYLVQTPKGPQEQELPKGEYKLLSNHVRGRDGEIHAYAPVDLTPEEVHRFCQELGSEAFQSAHPVLQASYAHYAFVVIHPFADGNGRVARALASIYTYRSHSVPLLILADTRGEYTSALEAADKGNFQPFVDFMLERALDGIQMVKESMDAATAPKAEEAIVNLQRLYVTKGGYTHEEIDRAGNLLFDAFRRELEKAIAKYPFTDYGSSSIQDGSGDPNIPVLDERYRFPISKRRALGLSLSSKAPAAAQINREFRLEVPKDANEQAGPIVRNPQTSDVFQARVEEVMPATNTAVQMRLSMFMEGVLGEAFEDLQRQAEAAYRQQGL